ncbi:hypothetical protein Nepgr_019583 [Nepenthes gracilis]|uniref:Uncharacterized protein n=1 Tax=Nepenthes gracilis TaxID=150966 RepID=A0AAD3XU95_NEPGR|nr:hypothetical protein Nepgr_019583 [Nepenthes gracilis]
MGNVLKKLLELDRNLRTLQERSSVGDRLVALDEDRLKGDYRRALRTEEATEDHKGPQRAWLNQRKSRASPKTKSQRTLANPRAEVRKEDA